MCDPVAPSDPKGLAALGAGEHGVLQLIMKVYYKPRNPIEFQFTAEPATAALKAALDVIRHRTNLEQLLELAKNRHGYNDSDGYFALHIHLGLMNTIKIVESLYQRDILKLKLDMVARTPNAIRCLNLIILE